MRLEPCWSCGSTGPCIGDCECAKCVDPEGYAEWRRENPEDYQDWLDGGGVPRGADPRRAPRAPVERPQEQTILQTSAISPDLEAAVVAWVENDPTEVIVRRKSDGLLIHFCSTVEQLRAAQASGAVAFNPAEVLRLSQLWREGGDDARSLADAIVRAKQSMPRIRLSELRSNKEAAHAGGSDGEG